MANYKGVQFLEGVQLGNTWDQLVHKVLLFLDPSTFSLYFRLPRSSIHSTGWIRDVVFLLEISIRASLDPVEWLFAVPGRLADEVAMYIPLGIGRFAGF